MALDKRNRLSDDSDSTSDQRIHELQKENRRLTRQLSALKNTWRIKTKPFRERTRRSISRSSIKAPLSGDSPARRRLISKAQARQMEEYCRLLLDSTPMICTLWDSDCNIVDCNQEAIKIIGLENKAEVIDHFFERNPERQANGQDTRSEMTRIIGTALEKGYLRYEWISRTATGELLPLEGTAVRIPWGAGCRVICYTQDLREIMEQRRRTREARERAKLLLDSTPLIATLWDENGNPLDCNQEAANVLGFKDKKDFVDHFFDRSPEYQPNGRNSRDEVRWIIKEVFNKGMLRHEWMLSAPDGEPLPLGSTTMRLPWWDGYRIISYSRDLCEIKEQRRLREEAEERARLLLDNQPLGASVWDENGNLIDCNQALPRLLGTASKTDVLQRFHDFHPEFQPDGSLSGNRVSAHVRAALATGYEKFEWIHLTESKETLPVEVTLIRMPWKSKWCIAAYVRDLRETLALQDAERRARLLLDFAPLSAVFWDHDATILDCNQACLNMFGLTDKADFINRFYEFSPEYQPNGVLSRDQAAANFLFTHENGYKKVRWMHRAASGELIPTEVTLFRVPWKDGCCVAAYIHDLRERIARKDAEERAELLLNFSPFGAVLWDWDGTILDCNQECLRLFGLTDKADFINRFYQFSPEYQPDGIASRDKIAANLRALSEKSYEKTTWMHCSASGEAIPIELTLLRVPWKEGWRLAAYMRDLRESIARMEAEEYSKILLDATPLGAVLRDADKKILFLNQATTTLFDLPDKGFLTDDYSIERFSPPLQPDGRPSIEKFDELFDEAAETGFAQCEWMHFNTAGEELPVEKTLVRIRRQNGWHIASYNRDLREVKMRERQTREEKAYSKTLLDLTPLGILLWNEDGEMIFCNHGALRLFGLSYLNVHFLKDKYLSQLHPPFQPDGSPSTEKLKDLFNQAIETGFAQCEWIHINAAGEELPVEKTLVRVKKEDGWHVASYNRDLRDVKAQERRRIEAEEYSKLLLDVTPLGVILWNREGKMLFCNQEALRFFGLPSMDSLAYNYLHQWHPPFQPDGSPSAKKLKDLINRAFDTGMEKCEWIHLDAAGEEVPVEKTLVRIFWQGAWHVASFNRDLRDIKAEEQGRIEAERRVKILLDATPVGSCLWDRDSDLLLCNQANLDIFGLSSKEEFQDSYIDGRLDPPFQPDGRPSQETWAELIRKAAETGFAQCEWAHLTASGQELPVEKTIVRIPWQDTWHIATYTRDLREIKAQEQRRIEAEERAKIILDVVPEGTILLGYDFNIIEYNHTFLRMFDVSEATPIPSLNLLDFVPEYQADGRSSKEVAIEVISEAFETGSIQFECMHRTISKHPMPAEVNLMRVPWRGDWRLVACIRDLRGAKARDQEILEAQEQLHALEITTRAAQIASQAKSEFLAKMSHELRTPLNAVIGFLGIEVQNEDLPDETAERLDISLDACHNLLHLINDILDISKIEAGQFELTTINYNLADLIDQVVSLHVSRIGVRPIEFQTKVDAALPSKIHGDELRIKQTLNNLLSNAFKYTNEGSVTLSVGLEPGQARGGNVSIRFSIRDTGQGIDKKNFGSLFTSYSRFDSKTNRLIEGTGLGLAISKNLIEMMGGRLYVESEYGKGSVFSFVIPQKVIDPTPIGSATTDLLTSVKRSRLTRKRRQTPRQYAFLPYAKVLVVDDVPANLSVAKAMLQQYAMKVDCVSSGPEAIQLLRSGANHYNAIFMDHMMPGMDGVETLHHIRALDNDHAHSVPIIILTANVISGNEQMFLDQGFQAFIAKPIDPAKLNEIIDTWVKDGREEISPPDHADRPERMQAPPAMKDEATSSLPVLEGWDIQMAVERFGDKAVFLDVLRSYAASAPEFFNRARHPTKEKLEEFRITVHGIKGSSYNIGANAFGDMAKELEEAAANKNWPKIQEKLPAFLDAAEKLMARIDILLPELRPNAVPEKNKPVKPAPDTEALAAFHEASVSCAHSKMEKLLQQLEQYRYQADGELVAWLRERVDAFDYDLINERLAPYSSH